MSRGRTVVVTGAASGIGFGIARAFAQTGANVALADIRAAALESACAEISELGVTARAYEVDVSRRDAMAAFAQRVGEDFGGVDVLCNNAGVAYPGIPIADAPEGDIAWVFGVNVFGIINGIAAFMPLLRASAPGSHIVNTASVAGLALQPGWHQGIYGATKAAVVALSEGLRDDVADDGIGISVLCPAAVATDLYATAASDEVRPARFGASRDRRAPEERVRLLATVGLDPNDVGQAVVDAVRERRFYVVTHPETEELVRSRYQEILEAYAV